ncbi:FAD-dependent oxidoreductase [Halovenus salina]|uniref:FAD-dependent oxidoreductase n=1 Tax=Halovenus salina TaxID=1510225 RepID=A0ABD5W5W6_9EURY|nr:FAD-dependent oxidoreductase [Halovenus salina]
MTDTTHYDIGIVGGGPAGCAAALFCARADLETILLVNGRSTLQKCAYVENYLGFPAGVEPTTLLTLAREHVERTGCTVEETTVETVIDDGASFQVHLPEKDIHTDTVVAASWADSDYLSALDVETEPEPDELVQEIITDSEGRTNVDGVWAAGRITGTHHQALVNAGDGARVALNLVNERRPAFYNDWIAPEGYYEQYGRDVPVGVEEVSHEERNKRATRGRTWMHEFFGG